MTLSLDKFTKVGLRQHLMENDGAVVIVKNEMYQTICQILNEKEMGTLCRLYDGDSLFVTSGSSAKPVGVDKTLLWADLYRYVNFCRKCQDMSTSYGLRTMFVPP